MCEYCGVVYLTPDFLVDFYVKLTTLKSQLSNTGCSSFGICWILIFDVSGKQYKEKRHASDSSKPIRELCHYGDHKHRTGIN